jgi:hypothetical protein
MKLLYLFSFIGIILLSGCELDKRERELEKRTAEINQKEQELILLQKQLELQEASLALREKSVDSTLRSNLRKDSIAVYRSGILGSWSVKMVCSETNCEGSAIGDVKKEQWDITYEHYTILVKAMVNNNLVHVYTGSYDNDNLQLTAQQDDAATATIDVTLQLAGKNKMEGTRVIKRGEQCSITYDMDMKKL